MTEPNDIVIVEQHETTESGNKSQRPTPDGRGKRSANSSSTSDKTASKRTRRGARGNDDKENEPNPLPKGFETDKSEEDSDKESDNDSNRSPSPQGCENLEVTALRQDIKAVGATVGSFTTNLITYVQAVHDVLKPVEDSLKDLMTGINYRNKSEQDQLIAATRDLNQLLNDLKEQKDKVDPTRYQEILSKMGKDIQAVSSTVKSNNGIISSVQFFLAGVSAAPRFVIPKMDMSTPRLPNATNPLPVTPRPLKNCLFCVDKAKGTHDTAECRCYNLYGDRLKRAIDQHICTRCIEHYEDDGTHIHTSCPQATRYCDQCATVFGQTPTANHNAVFCPMRKVETKKPKERHSKGDKGQTNPYNYMAGAFNR